MTQLQRTQEAAVMQQGAAWQRIRSQLQFAEILVAQHADQAAAWRTALASASQEAAQGLSAAAPDMPALVERVEAQLAPLAKAAKAHTVYLAGHAHIDMNWMWSWPETVSVTLDTFSTMLTLLEEFPEFHFSQSQASVYQIVQKHAPELLPAIIARIREGRWEVTASHWVEGDKNLAGGESLCRHLLYTRAYLRELLGLKPEDVTIDWSPDTFGHSATVPAYLARGGVKYLFLHRPGTEKQPVPEAFWWEAPDGSRVLTHNAQRRAYNCAINPTTILEAIQSARTDSALSFALVVYGVGDHGGGPTRRDLHMRREMDAWPVFPQLKCSRSQEYFARLAREGGSLPVIRGELNTEFTGCYTTQALVKRTNRLGEARVAEAEVAAVLDHLVRGTSYPGETLAEDWRRVLFSHFHDILPGSGVHDTRTYTHGQFQDTMASALAITTRALRGVAGAVDTARADGPAPISKSGALFLPETQGGGAGIAAHEGRLSQYDGHGSSRARPFVVFNLTATPRQEVIECTVWDHEPTGSPVTFRDRLFEAVDARGHGMPVQVLDKGNAWGHDFMRLAVPVAVPALGLTTVTLRDAVTPPPAVEPGAWSTSHGHHCAYAPRERMSLGIENQRLRVAFDMLTGRIVSLRDKQSGRELVDATSDGIGLEYGVERPHRMTAWCIDCAMLLEKPAAKTIRELRNGPYVAAVEVVYQIRESTATAVYALHQDDPRLHVTLTVDWFQRGTPETGIPNLRLALPLALEDAVASYEIPFGAADRHAPPDQEVPALRWAKVAGRCGQEPAGLLVMNDCKHGHALSGGTLRVNLIRSSYDPDPLPEIGRHSMAFALQPVEAELPVAQATRLAQAFCSPLLPVTTGVHPGRLEPESTLIALQEEEGLVLSGLKLSEKGDGLIARLYDASGRAGRAALAPNKRLAVTTDARYVDLMERPLKEAKPQLTTRAARIAVPPHGIASVWLKLKRVK